MVYHILRLWAYIFQEKNLNEFRGNEKQWPSLAESEFSHCQSLIEPSLVSHEKLVNVAPENKCVAFQEGKNFIIFPFACNSAEQ